MRRLTRTTVLASLLLVGVSAFATQVSNWNWPATAVQGGSCPAFTTRPGVCMDRGLMVSGGKALPMAYRLLDSATVPGRSLGATSSRWRAVGQR